MESGGIVEFLENKTILITGATGFLAKIYVEKILRVQPNVKKLYLLVRAADDESAMRRLQDEIIEKDLFNVLREKYGSKLNSFISEKVRPLPGDISLEDLGVEDSKLKEEMWSEIDVMVNFAASINFEERYDVALSINTMGALNVLNFAKKCPNIKMLAHVSTAYVCGEDKGLILEKPYLMGEAKKGDEKIDIEGEKKLAEDKVNQLQSENVSPKEITSLMKDFGLERARGYGWPNTYVFTKALGEMLLMHYKDDIPLIIMRPTMITSTLFDPFPGWIEGVRTIDSLIVGYGKGKLTCFVYLPQNTFDLIPADMVVNAIIVAMVARANQKRCSDIIYHVGSSLRNIANFSQLHDCTYRYFTANPWINKEGEPVKIGRGTVLSSMTSFYLYMNLRYLLPFKGLQLANTVMFQKYQDLCTYLDRKIKLVMRLVQLYKPYILFEGIFEDSNSEKLRIVAKEMNPDEAKMFNFDPMTIDWKEYMMTAHIPGLHKYSM
ncbi:alcohol-forming fatty acyl-CoA reductase-like [Euphorbia lathyris]|uniref:alcohol-forming fatty acyl-CoA reductase-like n=1 Tax=Euphorbia lathyris TaxID=212925 RepID=UPI00331364DC